MALPLTAGCFSASGQYLVTDLGASGEAGSYARAVSDSGIVAGGFYRTVSSSGVFTWKVGKRSELTLPAGCTDSGAYAVNTMGEVVGQASGIATRWAGGSIAPLGINGIALGTNDAGLVVGVQSVSDGQQYRENAFCWNVTDGVRFLPSLGGDFNRACAVNTIGQIVGYASTSSAAVHACLWQGETLWDLGTLGGLNSGAEAVSGNGTIVGYSLSSTGTEIGFHWTPEHGMIALPPPQSSTRSHAYGVNNSGMAVGSARNGDPASLRAIVWYDDTPVDLNTQIPGDSGWILRCAMGINDSGVIVGYGYRNGANRAFMLTPLVPLLRNVLAAAAGLTEATPEMIALIAADQGHAPRPIELSDAVCLSRRLAAIMAGG